MARVPRLAEDAVLRGLRAELEPRGFRYKARKLVRQFEGCGSSSMCFQLAGSSPIRRTSPFLGENRAACLDGEDGAILSLADAARNGGFYGDAPAVKRMRDLAQDPAERDAVLGAWESLGLPGTPI